MRRFSRAALALGCWWLAGAHAQEREQEEPEPVPDLDFLEYLGTWAEEDDEWLVIETWESDNAEEADEDPEKGSDSERDDGDESE